MSIRIKNLDLNTDGMKQRAFISLGDVTATRRFLGFVAPVACVVEQVDLYSRQAVLGASTAHTTITVQLPANSAVLQTRGTSATAGTTNDISALQRYRLTPSSNNSLSTGQPLEFEISQGGSGVMSAVHVLVTYRPLIHRETR